MLNNQNCVKRFLQTALFYQNSPFFNDFLELVQIYNAPDIKCSVLQFLNEVNSKLFFKLIQKREHGFHENRYIFYFNYTIDGVKSNNFTPCQKISTSGIVWKFSGVT